MRLLCRLGLHDWARWSDAEEICREQQIVEKRTDSSYSREGSGRSDKAATSTTSVLRRMIQTTRCARCNLEKSRVSFDEIGIKEVGCLVEAG